MAASSTDMAARVSIGALTPTAPLLAEPEVFPAPPRPRPELGTTLPKVPRARGVVSSPRVLSVVA